MQYTKGNIKWRIRRGRSWLLWLQETKHSQTRWWSKHCFSNSHRNFQSHPKQASSWISSFYIYRDTSHMVRNGLCIQNKILFHAVYTKSFVLIVIRFRAVRVERDTLSGTIRVQWSVTLSNIPSRNIILIAGVLLDGSLFRLTYFHYNLTSSVR